MRTVLAASLYFTVSVLPCAAFYYYSTQLNRAFFHSHILNIPTMLLMLLYAGLHEFASAASKKQHHLTSVGVRLLLWVGALLALNEILDVLAFTSFDGGANTRVDIFIVGAGLVLLCAKEVKEIFRSQSSADVTCSEASGSGWILKMIIAALVILLVSLMSWASMFVLRVNLMYLVVITICIAITVITGRLLGSAIQK